MRRTRRGSTFQTILIGALAAAFGVATATEAWGQYFGRNKVRYESFDFEVLETEKFDIYYYPEQAEAIDMIAVLAERWHSRLFQVLQHRLTGRQPLIFYAGHPHFRQTNATPGEIGEGTGGFTEMFKRRVVMPFAGPLGETDHVLGHELVHAFQFDLAGEGQQGTMQAAAAMRLPLWFIEGMAEYLSLGPEDPHTAMWIRDAVLRDDLPTVRRLGHPRYFPYRYGHAFWSFVGGRWGDDTVGALLRAAGRAGDVEGALRSVLAIDGAELSEEWHEALREEFGPQVEAARPAEEFGRRLVAPREWRGRFNLSPSLSPDGSRLVFFSERDLFSIELYLMDVETGEVLRRLTRMVTDPHLDSLQFLSSAGSWSPDGSRLVVGAVKRGRPGLRILDIETGRTVRDHSFREFVEILNPAWSPDGERIAFAANQGGLLDLFAFDLQTGELERLTRDPYSVLHPAWSPDGRRLVYVTDRFTTDLDSLEFGDHRLAVVDLVSGEIEPLPAFASGKHISPQWSPDGSQIYFISDVRGASNLYRLDLSSGEIVELTDVQTGISGISRLSPALSVSATEPSRVAVSVFDAGGYALYLLDEPGLEATPIELDPEPPVVPSILPPRQRSRQLVAPLLDAPLFEPREVELFDRDRYRPRLSLDFVAQPNVIVGAGSFGTFVGGGMALFWSDMLGDHNLMTLLQIEGESGTVLRNTAAVVAYENRRHRFTWGAVGGQIPFRTIRVQRGVGELNGEPVELQRQIRQWQINREVSGRVAYPFHRSLRLELTGGVRHIAFEADVRTDAFSLITGEHIFRGIEDLPTPDSLSLFTGGTALVYDNSLFGGTGPVLGQRYRLELSGTVGDLDIFSPLIDYRRYFLPARHLTLAGRVLHFGRYGSDAEDPRLNPLFVGNPTLMRGYTSGSFRIAECDPPLDQPGACPVFDQLFGSRLAVANVEARVPMFGPLGLVRSPGVPPIDVAAFYDAGIAWTRDLEPTFLDGDRSLVRSYGGSLRVNVLGFLIAQWSYVYPVDRPDRGWHWEFTITPGF